MFAFTILELLCVLATISILAALGMSGLSAAREPVQSLACFNNLRQLAIGMTVYTDTHPAFPAANDDQGSWQEKIGLTNLFCPSFNGNSDSSYGYNAFGAEACWRNMGLGGGTTYSGSREIKANEVTNPAHTFFAGDRRAALDTNGVVTWMPFNYPDKILPGEAATHRHRGKMQMGVLDGHAEAVPWSNVVLVVDRTWWNRDNEQHDDW